MRELTNEEKQELKITNLKSRVFEVFDHSGCKWLIRVLPDRHLEKAMIDIWDNDKRYPFRRTNRTELKYFFNSKELSFLSEV